MRDDLGRDHAWVLSNEARRAGLTEPVDGEGILHGWRSEERTLLVRRAETGIEVVEPTRSSRPVRATFSEVVDAEVFFLISLGVLEKEIRRLVNSWKKSPSSAERVLRTPGGHMVVTSLHRTEFASVVDARRFAAYLEIRRDARFPQDRLLTDLYLPEQFDRYSKATWTVAELPEVFATRPIDAIPRDSLRNYPELSLLGDSRLDPRLEQPEGLEIAQWLIDHGADVNFIGGYCDSETPLIEHHRNPEMLRLLLAHGASVDPPPPGLGRTFSALDLAARWGHPEPVRILLEAGADPDVPDYIHGVTPLDEFAFGRENFMTHEMLETAQLLVEASERKTPIPRAAGFLRSVVRAQWKRAARIRQELADEEKCPDLSVRVVDEKAVAAKTKDLEMLLELLGVDLPEPVRLLAPGEPITVRGATWREQKRELWDMLVPDGGAAESAQGEVIRIAGRVGYETLHNGGGNWGRDFRLMLDNYLRLVQTGTPVEAATLEDCRNAASRLRGGRLDEAAVEILDRAAVEWALANPARVPLEPPPYNR